MLSAQLIPSESITTKSVSRTTDVAPNYFTITQSDWSLKPRLDIVLTKDGTPVVLTKVGINSGIVDDIFKLKYKEQETQTTWKNYIDPATNSIQVWHSKH